MPRITRSITIIAAVISALTLSACASNQERVGQFADFAEAGATYTQSVPPLLDASLVSAINGHSLVLVRARELNKDEAFLKDAFDKHTALTRERADVLDRIRKQAALLEEYFATLSVLASSADDGAAAKATTGLTEASEKLAGELGELSGKIKDAKIGDQSVSEFLGSLASPVIVAYQRKALDRVLKATAEPVSRSLDAHKAALKAIREQMVNERRDSSELGLSVTILKPYLGGGNLTNDWGKRRLDLLTETEEIRELDQAVEASEKLERAFLELLRNDDDGELLKLLIRDLKGVASFAKKLV